MACGKVKWGLKSRAREWGGRAKGVIAGVRGWAQSGGRSWGGTGKPGRAGGKGQPDCLRCGLCKPQAILVLGSSCLRPDHIPGLGAARPPAPFRAPFSDPDQSLACSSSQDLLVLSHPAPLALDGPWLSRQGSWSGLLPREGDSGVGQIRPCQIWSLLCVELVCASFFFFIFSFFFLKFLKLILRETKIE